MNSKNLKAVLTVVALAFSVSAQALPEARCFDSDTLRNQTFSAIQNQPLVTIRATPRTEAIYTRQGVAGYAGYSIVIDDVSGRRGCRQLEGSFAYDSKHAGATALDFTISIDRFYHQARMGKGNKFYNLYEARMTLGGRVSEAYCLFKE